MEALLPILSKLNDVIKATGDAGSFTFPKIVAIGMQSSGKSSVIENLVGRCVAVRLPLGSCVRCT